MKTIKKIVKYLLITVTILISTTALIFLLQVYLSIRQAVLIWGDGYPLTNGYKYAVYDRRRHQLAKTYTRWELGCHLNRLYFDDRYIVGEISICEPPTPEVPNPKKQYTYFIFDTETTTFVRHLSESELETLLKRIGIWEDVKLVGRGSPKWLKKQKRRWYEICPPPSGDGRQSGHLNTNIYKSPPLSGHLRRVC